MNARTPRILRLHSALRRQLVRMPGLRQAFVQCGGIGLSRQFDRPLAELCLVARRWTCASAGTRVGSEVMVIAVGAKEECAGVAPRHTVDAECFREERRSRVQVADAEMHVANHGAGRHTGPRRATSRLYEILNVYRVRGDHQLAAETFSRVSRAVRIR